MFSLANNFYFFLSKVKIVNETTELIAEFVELAQLLVDARVATISGPQPLSNAAAIDALKTRIESFKE